MPDLRTFTLWARELLTRETSDLLQQVYRIDPQTGARLAVPNGHLLETSAEAQANRKRIEQLLDDEVDAGLDRAAASARLVRETAFTHLNRLVAFKLLEARKLVRGVLARRHQANGFLMWLADRPEEEKLYNQGDNPNDRDGFGEAPRDRAYRHFLLWQSGELAKEIRVLFDPDNVPSLLFPRPGPLKELIDALNAEERDPDWAPGNEETVGWVYQFFITDEKAAAFERVFKKKKKFEKTDVPAATQVFTPRWVVRFLVENSLGRSWLGMHPDSHLREHLDYLVPLPDEQPGADLRPVKEIRVLDPACGSMHFGLVAFDLLSEMYREELQCAGSPGWPQQPSVRSEAEIPAAILAHNLYGIDIDQRAVQLSALALYLKAKSVNRQARLRDSNLACADVAIFRGRHLNKIMDEMALPRGITRDLFVKFRDSLEESGQMGTLVRLETHFQDFQSERLREAIDAYVQKKREEGIDESYFANETGKGLRLLEALERRYDVVVTNPPYMSNRNMNSPMSEFLKRHYKKSKGDLYSAFMERCAELMASDGRLAMITQQSFMFISSFEDLRNLLLGRSCIEAMAHVGPRAFAEVTGEKVNTTAFVLRREAFEAKRREARGVYFRLVKEPDAEAKRAAFEQALERYRSGEPDPRVYLYRQGDFAAISGSPWVYWITPGLLAIFRNNKNIGHLTRTHCGMTTSDNQRFLRFWWEVGLSCTGRNCCSSNEAIESGKRWFPYMKGGSFKRWYGNQDHVVNWFDDGAEILEAPSFPRARTEFFRRGVTWTDLTAGKFSARLSPGGFIFDVKGSSAFPDDIPFILGLLNSSFANYALNLINPTVSYQVGDLARLPVPKHSSDRLRQLVEQAIDLARNDSQEDETTYDFIAPPAWPDGVGRVTARHRQLEAVENEIDEEVYRLYEISPEDRRAIEEELAAAPAAEDNDAEAERESGEEPEEAGQPSLTEEELAQRWVSYALGLALGRFAPGEPEGPGRGDFPPEVAARLKELIDPDGAMVLQRDHPDDLAARVIQILAAIHGEREAARLIQTAIGGNGELRDRLENYLLGPFFKAHVKQYRKRPIYWLLQSPKQSFSVYLFHERATDQTLALIQGKRYLGGRIFQVKQQLEEANRREASSDGREKARWRKLAQDLADLEAFDKAITETNSESIVDAQGRPAAARWAPEFDDGVLLNAAPLYRLTPAWKKADPKLDLAKAWQALKKGEYPWAKTAMRYWPRETLEACRENRSYRIAHGLE
ncbi:MAG: BREX-1 system adenine-specific DNA-methyltransferase PglX [Vicinamibacterales bacterium]